MSTTDCLTAILVFVTAIYAYLTHRMAKAADASVAAVLAQSEAMMRPYVTISPWVRPSASFFYLRIANTGRTVAQNVRLTLNKDFFQWGDLNKVNGNLRELTAFSQTIDSLAPGSELLFALGQSWVVLGTDANPETTPTQFAVTASYEYPGQKISETTQIDLRPYLGATNEGNPIVEELQRIRETLPKK